MKRYTRWSFYSAIVGVLAGISAAVFLILLKLATDTREDHKILVCFLPIAGFIIGWVYNKYGDRAGRGNNLILDEIHDPKNVLPLRMAPLVLFGTLITHLFGGSAGREGTAVQMAASLADQLTKVFRIDPHERKILLVAGAGAGFGAAIGAPLAGVIFGMEVIYVGRLRMVAFIECAIASFVAYYIAELLGAPHTRYATIAAEAFSLRTVTVIIVFGLACGLIARLFSVVAHGIERMHSRFFPYAPLRPFVGGLLIAIAFVVFDFGRYAGLGLPIIQQSFHTPLSFFDPALKLLFTAITVGSGFKGGEFIPLVFIGSTFGSAVAAWLGWAPALLAGLGFASVFAGAANTPIACTLMAGELFGWSIVPWALLACLVSYAASGRQGIYPGQR